MSTKIITPTFPYMKAKIKKQHAKGSAAQEKLREKRWRRNRYHLVASQCKLSVDDEESYLHHILEAQNARSPISQTAQLTKMNLLHELAVDHGDTHAAGFRSTLKDLTDLRTLANWDAREDPNVGGMSTDKPVLEGTWITLSKPNFQGCLGQNSHGDYLYSLGRMAWDMFCPTDLMCSIQGSFNQIETISLRERDELVDAVPKSLSKEINAGDTVLRTYNIITAFTIEPNDERLGASCSNLGISFPIKGVMTSFGYCLPDPAHSNRLRVWFTGGSLECNDDFDLEHWKAIFGDAHQNRRKISSRARVTMAKVALGAHLPEECGGMDDDGTISFTLHRPMAAWVDVLYMDSNMRCAKSQNGTVYMFARIPK